MEAADVGHVLEVGLIASVKFLLSPFDAERHFNFWESFAITTVGGITGIIVFYYAGSKIAIWWRHVKALVKAVFSRRTAEEIEQKPPKRFSKTKRFVVHVKRKFGLAGIAFITPSIISIPIGSIVAAQLFPKKKGVLLALLLSLVLWSLALNGLAHYLRLSQYIPDAK